MEHEMTLRRIDELVQTFPTADAEVFGSTAHFTLF